MTEADRIALEALNCRFDHTAALCRMVRGHSDVGTADLADALNGIAATLEELSTRMDAIINPRVFTA